MDHEQQFISDLHQSIDDFNVEQALAAREVAEARKIPRLATAIWANGDPDLSAAAFSFLLQAEDLALVPVLEQPVRDEPQSVSQAMRLLTGAELNLRRRIVAQIDRWLDDKRPVPQKPMVIPVEERVRPRRVCDEAYVTMRKLVHFGEGDYVQLVDENQLYDLPEAKRDAAIARARATNSWQRIIDPDSVIDG